MGSHITLWITPRQEEEDLLPHLIAFKKPIRQGLRQKQRFPQDIQLEKTFLRYTKIRETPRVDEVPSNYQKGAPLPPLGWKVQRELCESPRCADVAAQGRCSQGEWKPPLQTWQPTRQGREPSRLNPAGSQLARKPAVVYRSQPPKAQSRVENGSARAKDQ